MNFFIQIITVHGTISNHDYRGWGQCCWHIFRNQWIFSITWFAEKFGKVRNYCFWRIAFLFIRKLQILHKLCAMRIQCDKMTFFSSLIFNFLTLFQKSKNQRAIFLFPPIFAFDTVVGCSDFFQYVFVSIFWKWSSLANDGCRQQWSMWTQLVG